MLRAIANARLWWLPTGLLLCCAELGLPPSQCIYVGDAPTDGRAALATASASTEDGGGALGIGVSYGSHSAESLGPHFATVVHSVEELGEVLTAALRAPEYVF